MLTRGRKYRNTPVSKLLPETLARVDLMHERENARH